MINRYKNLRKQYERKIQNAKKAADGSEGVEPPKSPVFQPPDYLPEVPAEVIQLPPRIQRKEIIRNKKTRGWAQSTSATTQKRSREEEEEEDLPE